MGIFSRVSEGLKKTRDSISQGMESLVHSFASIDEDLLEELEEQLIMADVGAATAGCICDALRARVKKTGENSPEKLEQMIREVVAEMVSGDSSLNLSTKPSVILVIGVNGAGKTTTTGKLAVKLSGQGKDVLLCAADTFRAAAIEQLAIWAQRADAELVRHAEGSDPAAVVFDAIQAGKARGKDVIICDTAGRLHNKKNLMDELSKMSRVIKRELPGADVEVILVLDATTGQNAVNQARLFKEAAGLTGLILTKLDGTAKGGVIIGIIQELGIPVKFIGIGEGIEDLREFDAAEFAGALFSTGEEEA